MIESVRVESRQNYQATGIICTFKTRSDKLSKNALHQQHTSGSKFLSFSHNPIAISFQKGLAAFRDQQRPLSTFEISLPSSSKPFLSALQNMGVQFQHAVENFYRVKFYFSWIYSFTCSKTVFYAALTKLVNTNNHTHHVLHGVKIIQGAKKMQPA